MTPSRNAIILFAASILLGLAVLLIEVLEQLYKRLRRDGDDPRDATAEGFVRAAWARVRRPEFKAVIEVWLAARNDPGLGDELAPAIARMSAIFSPEGNPALARRLGPRDENVTFYRLASEAMIGLALGRATHPDGEPVGHEDAVIDLLATLARRRAPERRAGRQE